MKKIYADNRMTLDIGRQGENLARQIIFDLSDWMAEYGPGVAELIAQRPGEEAPYPVAVRREDTFVLWDLTSADTAVAGSYGHCELRWYVGDILAKSKIWRTWVEPAMDTPSETAPPEPEQGWVDQIISVGAAAKASADAAKADADRAAALAAEVAEKAAQTAQDASDAAKAMEAAQTAQRLAEEAQRAAKAARTAAAAAQAAAETAATDAAGAKKDAETAQKAAQDAAAAAANTLESIQTLYQEMQTWAQGVIQDVNDAGSAAVQSVQSAGDTQVQRVTDEGTTQTANAKAQADAAAQSADRSAQSAQQAEESAAVYGDVVADVNQLKQDLADITDQNVYAIEIPWYQTNKAYVYNGRIVDSNYGCQAFIDVSNGDKFVCKGKYNYSNPAYLTLDADNHLVREWHQMNSATFENLEIEIATNEVKLVCQQSADNMSLFEIVSISGIKLKDGCVNHNTLDNNLKASFPKQISVKNLFNKNDVDIVVGKYIRRGNFVDNARFNVSGFIPVEYGKTYTFPCYPSYFGEESAKSVDCFLSDKSYASSPSGIINENLVSITIQSPKFKYVRFNYANGSTFQDIKYSYQEIDNIMFVEAPFPKHRFYPFGDYKEFDDTVRISNENLYNPLFGKSVVFTGDSICHGSSANDGLDGWAGRIGRKNNMMWSNQGVSGGTIAEGTGAGFNICNTNFGSDVDYIIIEGGTNDADIIGSILNGNVPAKFGSYSFSDYYSDFDKTTFCGAFEHLIKRVTTDYPNARVGYIVAQKMSKLNTAVPDYTKEHNNRRAYFETAINICKKWGIAVLNLWDEFPLNPMNPSHYTQGENLLYTDGQHLTSNGYEYVYPKIEAWMKTL